MSAVEIPTMEDVRSAFGLGIPTPEPPAPTPPIDEPPAPPIDEPPTPPADPEDTPPTPPDPNPIEILEKPKDAHAFAELRTQNSKQQTVIKNIGEILGLDVKGLDNDALVSAVKELAMKAKSQSTGIDTSILETVEQFQAMQEENLRQSRMLEAQTQVSALRDKYTVPEEELKEFILKIGEDKPDFDPTKDVLDFEAEYLKRYMPKITERQIAKALADEAARNNINNQAPGQPPGNGGGQIVQQPVNTVKGLDDFLQTLESKL